MAKSTTPVVVQLSIQTTRGSLCCPFNDQNASEEVSILFNEIEQAFGKGPSLLRIYAYHPPYCRPMAFLFDCFF